jgi:glycosyltransferase involved in cell wall biosynthesis
MFLRGVFHAIDRLIMLAPSGRVRQAYIRMSYRFKTSLFPEYGSYIPKPSEIGSQSKNVVWMPPAIPGWVLDEMRNIARDIDPAIYPTDLFLAGCCYYSFPVVKRPGEIYRDLMQGCSSECYTHVFAIPWLKRGGADLVTLTHINLAARTPGNRVLVLMTEPGDSPWIYRIPAEVDIVNASLFVGSDISHDDFLLIISRLLVQLQVDVLHVINSRHVWEVVSRYGLALSQKTKIFASIYCDDYDRYGQPVGFARQYLPDCYRHLSFVFSDNNAFPALLHRTYGYPLDLFRVLKSPVDMSLSVQPSRMPEGKRVLWAGRLDRQKRPDLLLGVAKALPNVQFVVFGDSVLDHKSEEISGLKKLMNVQMRGGFDGVESLPFDDYPVFLYTSQWDGTPTMVIAAALASIPVVASCVGGVGDIITEERGYPVTDIENIATYVYRINQVLDNPALAENKALAAREYVLKEHMGDAFAQALLDVPGYMTSSAEPFNSSLGGH